MILGASVLCLQQVIFVYNFFLFLLVFSVSFATFILLPFCHYKSLFTSTAARFLFRNVFWWIFFLVQICFWAKIISNCLVQIIFVSASVASPVAANWNLSFKRSVSLMRRACRLKCVHKHSATLNKLIMKHFISFQTVYKRGEFRHF